MTPEAPALCPHCEGTAYVADDYGSSFSVKCNNPVCGAAVRLWATREKATAAWNRRPAPPTSEEDVERVAMAICCPEGECLAGSKENCWAIGPRKDHNTIPEARAAIAAMQKRDTERK